MDPAEIRPSLKRAARRFLGNIRRPHPLTLLKSITVECLLIFFVANLAPIQMLAVTAHLDKNIFHYAIYYWKWEMRLSKLLKLKPSVIFSCAHTGVTGRIGYRNPLLVFVWGGQAIL
jgi:hypothetical protein